MDAGVLVVGPVDGVVRSWIDGLTASGANVSVVSGGLEALRAFEIIAPDVVLIDVELGGEVDGFDLCREIRQRSDVLVVFGASTPVSADELVALAVGADGFFSDDITFPIVLAHLSSLLRRSRGRMTSSTADSSSGPLGAGADVGIEADAGSLGRIIDAELDIDLVAREVRVDGSITALTRIEFDLLVTLARSPRRVFSRGQLMEALWDRPSGSDHLLDTHLSRLRTKLSAAGGQRVAHAVRGVGFRLRT